MSTAPLVSVPHDFSTNLLMLFRWVHFLAGFTWVGLLYFFNLVNVPFMKEIDTATKGKVIPRLMPRALWWFRWSSVVTVIAGMAYWGNIVASDARNAGTHGDAAMASFLIIWTVTWAVLYALLIPGKGLLNKGPVLAVLVTIIVIAAAWLFLSLNDHGWESNRMLAIGIGGGIGWVMMLNVWGVIWRIQKRLIQWTAENAANGTLIPEKSTRMARMAFLTSRISAYLTIPLLFFMGAASHYPMFGR
ncbi:MAG: urate hydroxylase PuuD [Terriglobales bacterium]